MKSLMIGAIPSKDSPVWKISSEKVPHLTICYFGEQPDDLDLGPIREYIQHAIETSLNKFGLQVDRRGTLGEDKADVLFFDKGWSTKQVCDFRDFLLKNDQIRALYDSVDQYPEWTPHLTLGYPETPAHPDDREYPGISWVEFDRLAIWTGDYEGEEFELPSDHKEIELHMSDEVDDFFAHYGIKGMTWGKRRSREQIDADSSDVTQVKNAKSKIATNRTTDVLSNRDLQAVVTRMNLERQYAQLTARPPSKGKAFVKKMLFNPQERNKTAQLIAPLTDPLTGQVKAAFELGNDISRVRL